MRPVWKYLFAWLFIFAVVEQSGISLVSALVKSRELMELEKENLQEQQKNEKEVERAFVQYDHLIDDYLLSPNLASASKVHSPANEPVDDNFIPSIPTPPPDFAG
jgi:hypothetical protein